MSTKKPNGGVVAVAAIAGLISMSFAKVLGMTLLIPIVFSAVWYFIASQLDKRLRLASRSLGGFGLEEPSADTFILTTSVELGHLSWGLLGVGLALSAPIREIQIDASNYVELGIYLALFIAFCLRPSWWSILLIGAYHIVCVVRIPSLMDQLSDFAPKTRESLEKGYIAHIIFHGLAACLLTWYGIQRVRLGDVRVAVWKRWTAEKTVVHNKSAAERLAQLAKLHTQGLITASDLESKKKEILRDL